MEKSGHVTIDFNTKDESKKKEINDPKRNRSRKRSPSPKRRSAVEQRNRPIRDVDAATRDAIPLIPEAALPRQKPPHAGPEIDDDDNDRENVLPTHGIDDGFFEVGSNSGGKSDKNPLPETPHTNGEKPRKGSFPGVFPYAPPDYGGPGVAELPTDHPQAIPDINAYQHKKTLAQGMMDLALLSANANQLRYVLESHDRHPYYYFSITFIVMSLIFQILVGIGLVLNSRYDVKDKKEICKADKINNLITIAILLITIINVFISAFGVAEVRSA